MTKYNFFALLALLASAGCGDESGKDWDREVVLQLFKATGVDVGTLTVTASQAGGNTGTYNSINSDGKFFSSCETNKIWIIPKEISGAYPKVKVTVSSQKLAGLSVETEIDLSGATTSAKFVIVKGNTLEPAGCAPTVQLKSFGEACAADADCEGGKCLKQVQDGSGTKVFPGGYCTKSCSGGGGCGVTGKCVTYGIPGQPSPPEYCLRLCTTANPCPQKDYYCGPANTCLPP